MEVLAKEWYLKPLKVNWMMISPFFIRSDGMLPMKKIQLGGENVILPFSIRPTESLFLK